MAKIRRHLLPGAKILDIGSADGALFRRLGPLAGTGSMGVDPTLKEPLMVNGIVLQAGFFPEAVPASAGQFDAITMLAVLEHFLRAVTIPCGPGANTAAPGRQIADHRSLATGVT